MVNTMTDHSLSPAAQAVLAVSHTDPQVVAEILLAVADQMVPEEDVIPTDEELSLQRYCQRQRTRKQLLAIATELEGAND
jgi:hypothetical protein